MTTLIFDDKDQRDEMYASMRKDYPPMTLILSEDKGRYLLTFRAPAPRPSRPLAPAVALLVCGLYHCKPDLRLEPNTTQCRHCGCVVGI